MNKRQRCYSERPCACGAPTETKVAVILSEAKDLQFRSEANYCRFFAQFTLSEANGLRMTGFQESEARNLSLSRYAPRNKQ
jgi:hypothetical protein